MRSVILDVHDIKQLFDITITKLDDRMSTILYGTPAARELHRAID
jgi:hypothetical protein